MAETVTPKSTTRMANGTAVHRISTRSSPMTCFGTGSPGRCRNRTTEIPTSTATERNTAAAMAKTNQNSRRTVSPSGEAGFSTEGRSVSGSFELDLVAGGSGRRNARCVPRRSAGALFSGRQASELGQAQAKDVVRGRARIVLPEAVVLERWARRCPLRKACSCTVGQGQRWTRCQCRGSQPTAEVHAT